MKLEMGWKRCCGLIRATSIFSFQLRCATAVSVCSTCWPRSFERWHRRQKEGREKPPHSLQGLPFYWCAVPRAHSMGAFQAAARHATQARPSHFESIMEPPAAFRVERSEPCVPALIPAKRRRAGPQQVANLMKTYPCTTAAAARKHLLGTQHVI